MNWGLWENTYASNPMPDYKTEVLKSYTDCGSEENEQNHLNTYAHEQIQMCFQ